MNLRLAHRGRRRRRSFCAACLRLFVVLPAMIDAVPGFAACGSPAGRALATGVNERLEIALADGRTVRLGGLDTPNSDRGEPETVSAARDFLASRLIGRTADLVVLAAAPDRWGRVAGDFRQPETSGGPPVSIAAALLAAGYARVRPEFEARNCAPERLAIEDGARRAGLGIWRDREYAVIQSSDSSALSRRGEQFVLVEGQVRRVGFGRSRLYLDLVPRDGPTIVVARKMEQALARTGLPVSALVGHTIRARGALDDRFGPRIEVSEPAMIEILHHAGE